MKTMNVKMSNGSAKGRRILRRLLAQGCLLTAVLFCGTIRLHAAPAPVSGGITVTELTNSGGTFTTYGGLALDGSTLYFGNFDKVRTYDLETSSVSEWATCGSNAGTGTVSKLGSDVYMSMDSSYSSPWPSDFGTIDPTDDPDFTATLESGSNIGETTYSIYDSAVYDGNLYFVANEGTYVDDGGKEGQTNGTKIYRYDTSNTQSPVEIANIGGSSGGLTFDADGNLYYASQNGGEGILKFTAAEVASGSLTAGDGDTVLNITAGAIDFLSDGSLVAATGYGQSLDAYSLDTGSKLLGIATTAGSEYMGKFVVDDEDTLYALSTDWNSYSSGLYAMTVPEPTTLTLLALSGLALLCGRRGLRR